MQRLLTLLLCTLVLSLCGTSLVIAADKPKVERHVVVYGEDGKFGGWPANHGAWIWGDEILVGFSKGTHKNLGKERHNIDREKPEYHMLARSLDGGLTWKHANPAEKGALIGTAGMRHGIVPPEYSTPEPIQLKEPINFKHPDFCMTLRFSNVNNGASRFYFSYDRGHHWQGPFKLPMFDQPGIMARTDYVINGPRDAHLLLTASKQNGKEGRVICVRTTDGGLNWKFQSYVGPEPTGFSIMSSTVRISDNQLVTTTRRREGKGETKHRWIDTWNSNDNGKSWSFLNNAVQDVGEGNPPQLLKLQDGRLCVTYGDRKAPFEMRAKFSSDDGKTWSDSFLLKTNGGGRDLGYPRSVERPDGKIVTFYYFTPKENPYRKIYATIWSPGTAE